MHAQGVELPEEARVVGGFLRQRQMVEPLDQFRLDLGRYPTTVEGLEALNTAPAIAPDWSGPYLKKGIPADPWGRPYTYQSPGTHAEADLSSLGKDGRPGGTGENADVGNW